MARCPLVARMTCLLVPFALSACGGGGGGGRSSSSSGPGGQVHVLLTDAASDEIDRFEVDIRSIDLVKRNGARVHTLPLTTRVDFADLVEVAELLNAASVPHGAYREVQLTLDFSTAAVHIAGAEANAAVIDEDGRPIAGLVTVGVDLEGRLRLVVAPGSTRMLTLDFDLDASTSVDAAANTVTLSPVLLAEIDHHRPRVHRVRGPLESVDVEGSSFTIAVRPFRALVSRFGTVRVSVGDATHYEVNDACYRGRAGLEALAALPRFAAVVAVGRLDARTGIFEASEVLAGSSVPGGTLDVVRGHVASRRGNEVTVLGAQVDRANGVVVFNAPVTVVLDPEATVVTKQLSLEPQATGDVSVGQLVLAFGELEGSPGSLVLSPARRVRLLRTRISGEVKAVGRGSLTLEVQRFGRRRPDAFDFSGTGPEGSEADPSSYDVETGDIDLEGIAAGTPVRVFGFVTPFGSAPPDFEAQTVVDVSDVSALLLVVWRHDSDEQVVLGESRIELDLSDSPFVHHVERSGTRTDLMDLAGASLVPAGGSSGLYAIADRGMIAVFADFGAFLEELDQRLAGGTDARRLLATGSFDDASGELAAASVTVVLR
ncbi:MAG: DUF4382 domain-containing protein [Planctomycetes bacterium]|nr:DUF4382 domain-containing protein [Planctomycetota bacterium]